MNKELHRHDISSSAWEKIKPHTIGEKGTRGGNAKNTRQSINGVFWILRTGAPWRALPSEYGHWKNVHRGFCRWRDKDARGNIPAALIEDKGFKQSSSPFYFKDSRREHNAFALMVHDYLATLVKTPLTRAWFHLLNLLRKQLCRVNYKI